MKLLEYSNIYVKKCAINEYLSSSLSSTVELCFHTNVQSLNAAFQALVATFSYFKNGTSTMSLTSFTYI
jgi:hypothetical protein